MDLGLKNKTVIVTGGATGLGAAICAGFAQEGANLVIFDLGKPPGELPGTPPASPRHKGSLYLQGDVTSRADIERALSKAHEEFGGIDILVNNAGIWPAAKVIEMADEEWERTIQVNLTGAFLFSKRFVRYLNQE